jgi:hypothetical protein
MTSVPAELQDHQSRPATPSWICATLTLLSPNFTYRPAKLLILLVVTQLCSHKPFQIYVDTMHVQ